MINADKVHAASPRGDLLKSSPEDLSQALSAFYKNERLSTRILALFLTCLCVHSFQISFFVRFQITVIPCNTLCVQRLPPAEQIRIKRIVVQRLSGMKRQ